MRRLSLAVFALAVAPLLVASPGLGWTPETQRTIALEAARLAPPDLYRQLARNRASYLVGVEEPFQTGHPDDLVKYADGRGRLDEAITIAVDNAILAIRAPRPFNEIAYRLGIVAHYLARASDPLSVADDDPAERRYATDFYRYVQSTEPRVRLVFYGFRPLLASEQLPVMLDETVARTRRLYPMVGREYRRVGFRSGVEAFDDLSTAYAVAALGYSHAVSDIAEVLRYIWIAAGGIDSRSRVPIRGSQVVRLPRATSP